MKRKQSEELTNSRSKNITKRKRLNTRVLQTPTATSTSSESQTPSEAQISSEPSTSRAPAATPNENPSTSFHESPVFQAYLKEILFKCIDIPFENLKILLFNSSS